jgi:NTP pyrophosphatase (non-canonical NTP hydrolase)
MRENVLNTGYTETNALRDVLSERVRQDEKWGEQNHHPFIWTSILLEEFGEFAQEVHEGHFQGFTSDKFDAMRMEAVQVAAVALSVVESIDRNQHELKLDKAQ